jgi:hypothetical protein
VLLIRSAGILLSVSPALLAQKGGQSLAPIERPDGAGVSGEGAGHGFVTFQLGFFDMPDDGDGNPFLDEELTVIEPVIVFDYNATDRLSWGGTLSFDYVSSASAPRREGSAVPELRPLDARATTVRESAL